MNRKTKWSHRLLALALAAVMCCSVFPVGAFAETPLPQESTVATEEQQTDETETDNGQTDASNPDPGATTEESAAPTTDEPAEENEPYTFDGEILYADMPDAPTGSYIGSYGLPVATGEIKIGLSAWDADLEQDSYLSAEALDSDNLTLTTPLLEDTDYAIVPILAQVEYPADGSTLDLILPDGVTLLDYYGAPAENAESLLHNEYSETSAAVLGVYVQADADFTAQLVYTAPDGSCLTKTLQVTIDRNVTAEYPFPDSEIAAFAERPTPAVTSGKITKVAKVNGTWLIWFNGEPAYCCTHGANGQPAGCPTYTYVNTSTVNADQCIPGDHYGNQIRIWGGLNQLSLGDADDLPAVFSADEGEEISLLDFCASIYDDVQMYIIENFPESTTAEIYLASADELLNGVETYASARGYYTYIYNPGRAGWQTVALIGPEIGEEEPEPEPVVQEYYASWEAPAQTASGSFDFSYGVRTDKIQTATLEKVDGATIEIEPTTKSGSIEGGNWSISPAGKQTVTTSGHTADDNYQKNGGDASASWSLHYAVTKTSGTRNGQVGPFTTQEAADAAANSARDAAIAELQGEAQNAVNNAIAAAKAQLGSIQFRYEEITVPYGFGKYWGTNGSSQTISVPANTNNDYVMKNDEWSLQVNLKKTDSETGSQIATDAQYEIYQWDVVTGKYQPTGGYNTYSVQRQGDGSYAVINSAAYATTDSMRHTLYYTQRNAGKFIIVESKAPTGYFGDWTDINHPGIVNTPLGKRGYYIEITEDSDNSVIWLDNADYNADIAATDKGGTKLVTSTGVETTVTIYDTGKDSSRTFNTDNSGKAANEDSYTITPSDGVMKNDRTLGEISISKVDLDAVRYVGGSAAHGTALASGQAHGDAALDGAVYDLYAAEDITHPDGVTGVVDYSKIVDRMKHILTCSFGKDSIATALLALQHGEPLDELVYSEVMFSDTVSGELPEHKRFIYETAIPYFEKRGIPTRVLRGQKTYLDCFYHIVSRGNAEGKLASFPLTGRCSIQRDCKLPPIRTYQKTLPQDTVYYLGIAADEPIRLARLKANQTSLLAKYNLTEKDAQAMCQAEGLLSPLYAFTGRGGCWFCPNASMRELRHLYNAHPDLWQLLLELQDAPNKATERFNRSYTLHDLD